MESMQAAEYATMLDLKSAYFHIKVENSLSPYKGFSFDCRSFMNIGISFGWTRSPAIFYNAQKPVIKEIR